MPMIRLFDINPDLNRTALAAEFGAKTRVQIRDVLTDESARNLRQMLVQETKWGLSYQAGDEGPNSIRGEELAAMPAQSKAQIAQNVHRAMQGDEYAFAFAHYPMVRAYQDKWNPGGPHDILLEHLNDAPFMDLVRDVTGFDDLIKADGQVTLFAPNQFLALHKDSHVAEGWRVAYVLNMGPDEWRPDWGGYLQFFDADRDVIQAFKPRFNSLNLLAVPQDHAVSYVPPFAPQARIAVTGWCRNV